MTYTQMIAIRGIWVTCVLVVALTVPGCKPESSTLQEPGWMRDIQSFDSELGALLSKAKVPSQKDLEASKDTMAITDGYGGYVDYNATKNTPQYLANEKFKNTSVEWEFELLKDAPSYSGEIELFPRIGKKTLAEEEEKFTRSLSTIMIKGENLGPFKAGDHIRLEAKVDDFSQYRDPRDFDRTTGLVALYYLADAPPAVFILRLAKAEITRLPAKE